MAGHVACTKKMRNAYSILITKSEEKRPLRRPRNTEEDNTGMPLRDIQWEGVDWMHLAQNRDQ
jgi:hypothetical protein